MGLFKIDPKGSLEHDLRKIDRQFIPKVLELLKTFQKTPFQLSQEK